jgi:hypothetical protein
MFSAGHLTNPQQDDPRFGEFADAAQAAVDGSVDDGVWAVWRDDSGEILAVVYQGEIFTPEEKR